MISKLGIAAGLTAVLMAATTPAAHAATGNGEAVKLRKLDIMLMVNSLRCRSTPESFQSDYAAFASAHLAELNEANSTIKRDLTRRYGRVGGKRAFDRMSTQMANEYGGGHPWLNCHGLKQVTHELAHDHHQGALLAAADDLLDGNGRAKLVARY